MPKEIIRDADNTPTSPHLEIRWNRDGSHVQIATVAPDGLTLEPDIPEGNGWFITPTRYGINQAIRALRRARDQAYGKDA